MLKNSLKNHGKFKLRNKKSEREILRIRYKA
jgi:hypothetical protein